jgi:GLPGLI family protein
MKRIKTLFALLCIQLCSFGQSREFEGVLVYELHTYNGLEKSSSISHIKYSVKGNLWRGEIVGSEDSIALVSYSLIVNLKSKEATLLANISNTKMAVASESFFQIEKTNSFSPEADSKKMTIAGLQCKSGVILSKSDNQKTDTTSVWYTTSYAAIPFQFETATAPGLIVSIQQDKNSFWELIEIKPRKLSSEIFEVPYDYKHISLTEFQEYLSELGELEMEVENLELD